MVYSQMGYNGVTLGGAVKVVDVIGQHVPCTVHPV